MSNQGPYGPPPQGPPRGPQQGPQYPPPQGPPQYGPPPPQYGPPPQHWGPPPGQPQFGWGAPPRPPKKTKGPLIALVVVLGTIAVGGIGLAVLSNILKHNGSDDDPSYSSPTYSSPYTAPTEEPTEEPSEEPSTTAPQTTSAPRTSTQPTQPTKPQPTKTTPPPPSDLDLVARNRIYKSGVQASVGCREPAARPTTLGGAQRYYQGILACLNKAWPKQVAKSGGRFRAPRMVVFSGSQVSSPCTGSFSGAFYCSSNDTIYMDGGDDLKVWRTNGSAAYQQHYSRMLMADTVAHEYGHHVQWLVGILDAQARMQYDAGSNDAALQIARRKELQASCFGNVFLGTNKNSLGIKGDLKFQLDWLHSHQGDEYGAQRDHGSRDVLKIWTARAYASRNPASCNTFTASPQMVR